MTIQILPLFLTIAWYDENDLRPIFLNKKAMID